MASSGGSAYIGSGNNGPSTASSADGGNFTQFMSEVKEIEKRDSVLTSAQQIERLLRPGSTYFNLNPFEVLQVDPETPVELIKKHYRKMSILVHPDKNPDDRDRAQTAFEILSKAMKSLSEDKERESALEMIKEAKEKTEHELGEERKLRKKTNNFAELEEDTNPQKDQSSSLSASNKQQLRKQKQTPAQESLRANIWNLEVKVNELRQKSRELEDLQMRKTLKATEDALKHSRQKLAWLEGNAAYQKKYRQKRKKDLAEIKAKHPLVAYKLRQVKRSQVKDVDEIKDGDGDGDITSMSSEMKKPVQEEIASKILQLEGELTSLRQAVVNKTKLEDGKTMSRKQRNKLIIVKKAELTNEKQKLSGLQANAVRQKKYRERRKKQLAELQKTHPQLASKLQTRNRRGRPRIEESQPDLLKVLEEVAGVDPGNQNGGKNKPVLTGKSLRDLTQEMKQRGFKLSRSAAYLRLAPKEAASSEGKRHVNYVPIKLRPQTGHGKQHIDNKFAAASIQYLEELASILGPKVVGFVVQDDRGRVGFRPTGANSSDHMLLEYKVTASENESRVKVADGNKLISSLYAACQIQNSGMGCKEAIIKTGPSYIAIRSSKHLSSAAYAHWDDFNIVVQRPEFKEFLRKPDGSVKPVLVLFVSGSQDENPRTAKALQVAACHFKVHNLDAMFIVSDAPGKGTYNPVEKRIQILAEGLSNLALPHNQFTSHLNEHGCIIDEVLEKDNFRAAGETLSAIWSEMPYECHPTVTKYVEPSDEPEGRRWEGVNHDERWKSEHVRQSQYCLQIVRCDNDVCCGPWRSNLKGVLSERFIPPPIPYCQGSDGPEAPEPNQSSAGQFSSLFMRIALSNVLPRAVQNFQMIPYDLYCPSLQVHLNHRICRWCGLYHVSQKALRPHARIHSSTETQPSAAEDTVPVQIEKLTELVEAAVATEVAVSESQIHVQVQAQPRVQVQTQPQVQMQVPQDTSQVLQGAAVVCMPEWSNAQWTTAVEQRPQL